MSTNKIKKIRTEKKLTIRDLSKICGVSIGYLSNLENGRNNKVNPTYATMKKISDALGSKISDVFDEK